MTDPKRLPRLAALFIRLFRLGDYPADVEADFGELFEARRRDKGSGYATRRLIADVLSLARPSIGRGIWLQDLRCGVRLFRRHPAIIGATLCGLALAIAVSTAVFTILNVAVLRPFGMDDPHSVTRVNVLFENGSSNGWPYGAFRQLQDGAALAGVEAFYSDGARFGISPGGDAGRRDDLLFVSGGYMPMLGGRAVIGRSLQPSDDDPAAAPVIVLNHSFWRKRLGGDPTIVGRTVWLSGSAVTVVGVIDPAFTGPSDRPPSFWTTFGSYGAIYRDRPLDRTSALGVNVMARVARGTERASAQAQLSTVAAGLPEINLGAGTPPVKPSGVRLDGAASPIDGPEGGSLAIVIGVILLVVGLVLALACANVANLLLAGAASRAREIGVRLALGASRRRIARQLLTESLLIGVGAGALGLLLSLWLVPILATMTGLPSTYDVRPDRAVLLFATVVALASGVGAGLAPARFGARGDLTAALKSQSAQSGTSERAAGPRRWFIGFQAAASMLLLVTAALFTRAALHITHVDLGFEPDKLVAVTASFPRSGNTAADAEAYWRLALERMRAVPSVESASLATSAPFGGSVSVTTLRRRGSDYFVYENRTDAGYFATAGFRLVRGRGYDGAEVAGNAPVAIVSESIVRDFFGGADPIGASLKPVTDELSGVTVIGVVADALTARVRGGGSGMIYRPIHAKLLPDARLIVRTSRPGSAALDIDKALLAVDSRVRPDVSLVNDGVQQFLNEPRILAGLSSGVAILALILAVLGLYGVTTFVVGQRTREVSVRMAMGAQPSAVVRLLARQSLAPVAWGLAGGLAVALAGARILSGALSGLSPYDPVAIASAVCVLMGAGALAVIMPARRASQADPATVLRQQ